MAKIAIYKTLRNDLLISAPPYDENKNSTLPNDNVENFSFLILKILIVGKDEFILNSIGYKENL